MTITLYDIPSSLPGKEWAPNPYKAKFALDYKGIPFNTEWVEFPDIEKALKAVGAPPSSVGADGNEKYTTPAIVDSETGKKISDSMVIAEYLDETYPDKPTLFPPGTAAAIAIFQSVWHKVVLAEMFPLMLPRVFLHLNPESQVFFRKTREPAFGCKIEEILPVPKRPEQLEKLKAGLSKVAASLDKNGKDKLFFLGDTFSYADCIIGGWLIVAKKMWESSEWEAIAAHDGGRWGKIVEHCEKLKGSASKF